MRILIVEDSVARIAMFRQVLRGEIVSTDSPVAAIVLLRNLDFDVLFLDFDLGRQDCDGGMVAAWLESNPQPSLRIIIHSMNPAGAAQMHRMLPQAERRVFPPWKTWGRASDNSSVYVPHGHPDGLEVRV